jgi:hypothetical protein
LSDFKLTIARSAWHDNLLRNVDDVVPVGSSINDDGFINKPCVIDKEDVPVGDDNEVDDTDATPSPPSPSGDATLVLADIDTIDGDVVEDENDNDDGIRLLPLLLLVEVEVIIDDDVDDNVAADDGNGTSIEAADDDTTVEDEEEDNEDVDVDV